MQRRKILYFKEDKAKLSGTTSVGNNNNFTPEQNKRWDELIAAEEERDRNRQNSDGPANDEQRLTDLFADANKKIDKLVSEANQKKGSIDADLEKIVQNLANDLKALGFPVNKIASEIVRRLEGRITRSWIHEILGNEYKDKTHQEFAKKCWKHKDAAPDPVRHEVVPPKEDLTPSLPNEVAQIMVGIDGLETANTNNSQQNEQGISEDSSSQSQQPSKQPIIDEDSTTKESPQPQPQSQQDFKVLIDWDELSDKMAELHHKGIKNFWLCGRIENGTNKLLDMVLERDQQPQMAMA